MLLETRRSFLAALGITALSGAAMTLPMTPSDAQTAPKPPIFTDLVPGVAAGGYDAVAYFTAGKPVEGKADITLEHEGVTWRFSSEANREAFRKEPARYAPQYGGYCAWAVAQGYTAKGDPLHWSVVDGRLFLNFDANIKGRFDRDQSGFIKKGDANWPTVLGKR